MIPFARAQDYPFAALLSSDFVDWPHTQKVIYSLPERFRVPVSVSYRNRYRAKGQQAANLYLLQVEKTSPSKGYTLAASDAEIGQAAKDCAAKVAGMLADTVGGTVEAFKAKLEKFATDQGVTLPEKVELRGVVARLTDSAWWRRQFRRTAGRKVEGLARSIGLVQKSAGIYASDETVSRHQEQKRRNLAALENATASKEAINRETGEIYEQTFTLAELAALGVSNPSVRFAELMVRVRGMEAYALDHGHTGLFVTGTAPASMHAYKKKTGRQNRLFDGTDPREAQSWISRQWARIRATLARLGVKFYGVRVAEPHHDGTPHWHMLVFIEGAASVSKFQEVFRKQIIRGDWKPTKKADLIAQGRAQGLTIKAATLAAGLALEAEEAEQTRRELADKGRQEHACDFKLIEAEKGSAAGYLVKYLAKNISGERMGQDDEAEKPATETAGRVLAWASCWGIRQFQVIGGPPVGVWRELRRIKEQPEQLELFEAWAATGSKEEDRKPDWSRYMAAQEGENPVTLWKLQEPGRLTKYHEEAPARVAGVECAGVVTKSRDAVWEIRRVGNYEKLSDAVLAGSAGKAVKKMPKVWGAEHRSGGALLSVRGEGLGAKRPRTRVNNCTERSPGPWSGLAANMAGWQQAGNKQAVIEIFNEVRRLKNAGNRQ